MTDPRTPAETAPETAPHPSAKPSMPNPWTARIGLLVVAGILVTCFSLLIAASHAATSAL